MPLNSLKDNVVHDRNCPDNTLGLVARVGLGSNRNRLEPNLSPFLVLCSRGNFFNLYEPQCIYLQSKASNYACIIGFLQKLHISKIPWLMAVICELTKIVVWLNTNNHNGLTGVLQEWVWSFAAMYSVNLWEPQLLSISSKLWSSTSLRTGGCPPTTGGQVGPVVAMTRAEASKG